MKDRIRMARESAGLTQQALAKVLSMNLSSINRIEAGSMAPSDRTICDICNACHVNVEWVKTGNGPMKKGTVRKAVRKKTSTEKPSSEKFDVNKALEAIAKETDLTPLGVALIKAYLSAPKSSREILDQMIVSAFHDVQPVPDHSPSEEG